MFPFLESRRQGNVTGMMDEDAATSESTNLHSIALKAIAGHMISAIKSGDAESLATALDSLCEICISEYDEDESSMGV